MTTKISNDLIKKFGHYVQAINYPTVPKGEEKLRIAPTPHHTVGMMDQFALDLAEIWTEVGLALNPRSSKTSGCGKSEDGKTCVYCAQPLLFEHFEARVRGGCDKPFCPQANAA